MDRIAACKTYHGSTYRDSDPLEYLLRAQETPLLHKTTYEQLKFLLTKLQKEGEKATFRYIRQVVLRGVPMEQWK